MRFTAYEEALRTPSRRLKNEKPNQHPGDSPGHSRPADRGPLFMGQQSGLSRLHQFGSLLMHGQNHGGKGSAQRTGDRVAFANNWDAIFGRKGEPKPEGHCPRCDVSRFDGEFYSVEHQDSYDIGDATVWEKYYINHCDNCDEELEPID